MKFLRVFPRYIGWVLFLMLAASGSAAAQGKGTIRGAVTTVGPDGVAVYLPGARIVLRCERITENSRSTLTDETGHFAVFGLAGDNCTATASAEGFHPETKTIQVTEKAPLELSFQLRLATLQEKVTVSGETVGIEPSQTSDKGEIKSKTLENAPLRSEQFTDAIPLLPGVVRGLDAQLNIKGARASQSGLVVNSANVTDPVTGEYGFNLPVEVVQNVRVLTNPYDAEYGKFTGAVTAVETRSGQNNFKIQVQNFFPRARVRDGVIAGIASFTPRVILSGPIKKGRLYFQQSLEYRFNRTRVPGLAHLDEFLRSDTALESFDSHTQFDAELNASNHLAVSISVFPQKLTYVNLNTFNQQEVTPSYRQRGVFFALAERKTFAGKSLLDSFFSIKDFDVDAFPAGDPFLGIQDFNVNVPYILRPELNAGSYFNRQDRTSRRYEWQEVYRHAPVSAAGQHLFALGVNVSHSNFDGIHSSRPVQVQRSNGALAQLIEFVGPTQTGLTSTETTFFLQDKWTPHSRITFDAGFRYDRDTLGENDNFAPRFGFALVLTKDNKTLLRGGVGRFFDKIPLNVAAFGQLQSRRVTSFAADGITPLGPALLFANLLESGHLANPRSIAWSAELDREVTRNLVVRFSYQQRRSRREFFLDPVLAPQPALLLKNTGRSFYREFQLTARYQVQEKGQWIISYVRSNAVGDLNDFNQFFGNFENPIIRPNERSLLPFDATNRFLTWAELELPHGITASPVFEVHDGFPFSLVNASRDFIGPRNRAGRYPTFVSLDLQVTKRMKIPVFGRKLRSRIGFKVFNLTNHFNPRDIQNNIDSSAVTFRKECAEFGQFCNSVRRAYGGKFVFEF